VNLKVSPISDVSAKTLIGLPFLGCLSPTISEKPGWALGKKLRSGNMQLREKYGWTLERRKEQEREGSYLQT
jgi:hypothetical protein